MRTKALNLFAVIFVVGLLGSVILGEAPLVAATIFFGLAGWAVICVDGIVRPSLRKDWNALRDNLKDMSVGAFLLVFFGLFLWWMKRTFG